MIQLTGLINLHKDIKANHLTYQVFKYKKNQIEFDVFFDTATIPYRLGFLVIKSNFNLWTEVHRGFYIDPTINPTDYKALIALLNLKYDPNNKFSTKEFFSEFNDKIPEHVTIHNKEDIAKIISKTHRFEEQDKIYYFGFIDWDTNGSNRNRSQENLEKTRLLRPDIYTSIKDKNISIKYTANKEEELDFRRNEVIVQ